MLVRITSQCSMQCPHCMVNSKTVGEHMELDVFRAVMGFVDWMNMPLIMLSGGEPTEHPQFPQLLELLRQKKRHIGLLSNGLFLTDPDRRDYLDLVDSVQVTNDPRFYPQALDLRYKFHGDDKRKIHVEHRLRMLVPVGRAKNPNFKPLLDQPPIEPRTSPMCFNLRSMNWFYGDFRTAVISLMTNHGRFCTPSINLDGSIVAGEAPSCYVIGSVLGNRPDLSNNLRNMGGHCNRCGLVGHLTHEQKLAIGEAKILTFGTPTILPT